MAITDKVIESLKTEFNQPLRSGEKRKIIFWNDFEKEFIDIIDEIKIPDVEMIKLNENNNFYTKYLIEIELDDKNLLVYNTEQIDDERDNWLLDTMIYSKEFFADNISLMMKELNIDSSLRKDFVKYKSYFGAISRRNRFLKFEEHIGNEDQLKIGILSSITNAKSIDFEEVVKIIFMESLNESENKYFEEFKKYNVIDVFWHYADLKYGYNQNDKHIKKLFIFILTTALSIDIDNDRLRKIKDYIGNNKPNCKLFINHWMLNRADYEQYDRLTEFYEYETNIADIIDELELEEYKDIELLKCFDRAIIKTIVESLKDRLEDYDLYIAIIKGRRVTHFYEDYKNVYEALINAIGMFKIYKIYGDGLPKGSADKLYNLYVKELYRMDTYYRKFYYYFDKQNTNIMNQVKDLIENLYCNWYLNDICNNFTSSIDNNMKREWLIPNIINQKDFYSTYVKSMVSNGERVFVIISDAFRYEVGVDLGKRLSEKVINSTNITSMLSCVPSITKLGMASLLPNKSIVINDNGRVFVDDMDSSGIENRDKILKKEFNNSIAIDYHKIPNNKVDFIEQLKGYKLIYIYHDTIDATADKGATEINTFEATEKAVNEIEDLINRKIVGWLGGTNVFVTADHGFIYQRSDLKESDKVNKEAIATIDKNRRCLISKESIENDELLKIKMSWLDNNETIYAYMPKSNIRFKVQGEGSKFVHGGATLQEVIVPVVAFKNIRSNSKKSIKARKVDVKLTNESRKITMNTFKLEFFQTEKIGEKILPTSLELFMVDKGDAIISDIKNIIADSTSERPEERIFKIKLHLKSMTYNKNDEYRLMIKDNETGVIIEEIPFTISLGIASEFDF